MLGVMAASPVEPTFGEAFARARRIFPGFEQAAPTMDTTRGSPLPTCPRSGAESAVAVGHLHQHARWKKAVAVFRSEFRGA
jgi:hypothetical protein